MSAETISLQEFMIEVRRILRKNNWSAAYFLWHTIHFVYSECDPADFLWFLLEVNKRKAGTACETYTQTKEPV
jgi:hypothetical protein